LERAIRKEIIPLSPGVPPCGIPADLYNRRSALPAVVANFLEDDE
jgi:hypothetical protein